MVEINSPRSNSDNTVVARINNLTRETIHLQPYGGATIVLPPQHYPQVVDEVEHFYLDIQGVVIPVVERLTIMQLPKIEGVFYIVDEKTKKCYKDRADVLTATICEAHDINEIPIIRKLYL